MTALYFYSQASDLRSQLLLETERVAAVRLMMEKITTDLRCASSRAPGGGLSGDATSLKIVRTGLPSWAGWSGSASDRGTAQTDLRVVNYRLSGGSLQSSNEVKTTDSESNVVRATFSRSEEPLGGRAVAEETSGTNQVTAKGTNLVAVRQAPTPMTEAIQYVRFRYWNGSSWVESWSGQDLPAGVEISLGEDPPPLTMGNDPYPSEVFRRVIYLPGGVSGAGATNGLAATNATAEVRL